MNVSLNRAEIDALISAAAEVRAGEMPDWNDKAVCDLDNAMQKLWNAQGKYKTLSSASEQPLQPTKET